MGRWTRSTRLLPRRTRSRLIIASLAVAAFALFAPFSPLIRALIALDPFAPATFTNHPDQIRDALSRHNITVARVYVEQGWPDRINSQTYGANLMIYASDGLGEKPVLGRVECRDAKKRCWFQVAKLGVRREELIDLAPYRAQQPPPASMSEQLQTQFADMQTCAVDVFAASSLRDLKTRAKCLTSVLIFPRITRP
jgi:hypothetical protein